MADITGLIETCDNCAEVTYLCDDTMDADQVSNAVLPDVRMEFTGYAYFEMANAAYDWDSDYYNSDSDGGKQGSATYWNSYGPFDDESNCAVRRI